MNPKTLGPLGPSSCGAGSPGLAADKDTRIYKAVLKMETKDLQVIPLNASDIIKVTYQSESPRLAAQVLKELGDLYLAKHTAVRRHKGRRTSFSYKHSNTGQNWRPRKRSWCVSRNKRELFRLISRNR